MAGGEGGLPGPARGVTEPQATFSTCFGAPFMVHFPTVYADLLGERLNSHKCTVWLVNTGWSGGALGGGQGMRIGHTRALVTAAPGGATPAAAGSWEGRRGAGTVESSRAMIWSATRPCASAS